MRIIQFIVAMLVLSIFSMGIVSAQENKNQPFIDLGKKVREEYASLDYVTIYNKIPFSENKIPDDATLDSTKPTEDQRVAIKKFIQLKKQTNDTLNNLYLKNAPYETPGFTHAFVNDNVVFEKKVINATEELYNGKLTFGQYNKKRQQLESEYLAQQAATKLKYEAIASKAKAADPLKTEPVKTEQAATAIKPLGPVVPFMPPAALPAVRPLPPPPSPPVAVPTPQPTQAMVIGKAFDPEVNGYVTLYSSGCREPSISSTYPLYWEATNSNGSIAIAPGGRQMMGCYFLNQQTSQVMLGATGINTPFTLPFSAFNIGNNQSAGGGGILDFLRAIGDGVTRAATYYNNSAAQTQSSMTNLTGSTTGGNRMSCTPDGRGGFYCK